MKNSVLRVCALLVLLFQFALRAAAQGPAPDAVDMADTLRQNGKIYVVVAVMVIIVAGLLLYMFSLDRKVRKLEKDANS